MTGLRRRPRHAALRRRHQPQRRVAEDVPRRDPGRHRPERRRQDVAVQLPDRGLHPAGGQRSLVRAGPVTRRSACSARRRTVVNRLGVARTFQNIRLFPALTALENVKVGVETRQKSGPIAACSGCRAAARRAGEHRRGLRAARAGRARRASQRHRRRRWPTASSGGWRSPGRSGTEPRLLLLDEPAAGTNPTEKRELAEPDHRASTPTTASACC